MEKGDTSACDYIPRDACPLNNNPFKGAYWISSNSSCIQYCDSNIELFSIAPPFVIALPTLRKQSCRS